MRTICYGGHAHPSKWERTDCDRLLAEQQAGRILAYRLYPSVELHVGGKLWKRWKVDFLVTERDGTDAYFESKGWNRSDDNFKLKLAAFLTEYPETPIYVNWRAFLARERCRLSPGLRCLIPGLTRRKRRPPKWPCRSWDRKLKRWVTVKW